MHVYVATAEPLLKQAISRAAAGLGLRATDSLAEKVEGAIFEFGEFSDISESVRVVREAVPFCFIVAVLSPESNPNVVRLALVQGANGFVLASELQELCHVLKQNMAGQVAFSPGCQRLVAEVLLASRCQCQAPDPSLGVELTPRERQVLEGLALGYSYKEIAINLGRSPNTIGSHVKKLYSKLGVMTKAEAVWRGFRFQKGSS